MGQIEARRRLVEEKRPGLVERKELRVGSGELDTLSLAARERIEASFGEVKDVRRRHRRTGRFQVFGAFATPHSREAACEDDLVHGCARQGGHGLRNHGTQARAQGRGHRVEVRPTE